MRGAPWGPRGNYIRRGLLRLLCFFGGHSWARSPGPSYTFCCRTCGSEFIWGIPNFPCHFLSAGCDWCRKRTRKCVSSKTGVPLHEHERTIRC